MSIPITEIAVYVMS